MYVLFGAVIFGGVWVNPLSVSAQHSCADMHSGEYYFYPRNTPQQYHVVVSGDMEKVVNLNKRKGASYYDSSVYKIEWKGDCDYTLKYQQGSGLGEDDLKFLAKHKVAYHVGGIGPDYFVFSSYIDRASPKNLLANDTMWMHPQTHTEENMVFGITDPGRIRKIHFSDTSRMALLYIYRPGKLKLSFSPLLIYYNDLPMVVLKNKTAAVVAIFKEGAFTLRSRVSETKVEGDLPMEIKFGNSYFVRADMIWGLYKTGNTKLEFTVMEPKEGKQDFDAIYKVE
ncbi:MAG TPA: hypothetical protein VGQ51_02900 [Puia sp.]|jgi:hypothetical protein|nr:hypothetical protein [Puia sp.]